MYSTRQRNNLISEILYFVQHNTFVQNTIISNKLDLSYLDLISFKFYFYRFIFMYLFRESSFVVPKRLVICRFTVYFSIVYTIVQLSYLSFIESTGNVDKLRGSVDQIRSYFWVVCLIFFRILALFSGNFKILAVIFSNFLELADFSEHNQKTLKTKQVLINNNFE